MFFLQKRDGPPYYNWVTILTSEDRNILESEMTQLVKNFDPITLRDYENYLSPYRIVDELFLRSELGLEWFGKVWDETKWQLISQT